MPGDFGQIGEWLNQGEVSSRSIKWHGDGSTVVVIWHDNVQWWSVSLFRFLHFHNL